MRKIVIDVENTITKLTDKYMDFTPYNPSNRLVSIGWAIMEDGKLSPIEYLFIYHKDLHYEKTNNVLLLNKLKSDIASCQGLIAHNAKYDMQWLEESGFKIDHLTVEDTMIREYVMARGRGDISFKLSESCKRYKVAEKGELFEKYPKLGIDEMPIAEVEEYGRGDIQACAELYLAQEERLSQTSYQPLLKTIGMMNEFCRVLTDMERAGVAIDEVALDKVRLEFEAEQESLKFDLETFVRKYMGDTKINLDSPAQLSEVIYSRRIKEGMEEDWVQTFNIGKDDRNKNLRRPKMKFQEYAYHVQRMCSTVKKTVVEQCTCCKGQGKVFKVKKDGTNFKKPFGCKECNATGAIYKETDEVAGFMMRPNNINFTTVGGFSTSKGFLEDLLDQATQQKKEDAYEFIKKVMRLSSISSYLSNFVGGISVFMQKSGILHANFNQCITSTGRLSSTKPNLQNMPREATFPIRRVFVSRFNGGKIIDTDFSQLEFRAAVHLAKDNKGREDILNGLDVHNQTAKIITDAGQPITRQEAKSRTFKPLFAGSSGTDAEKTYYSKFLTEIYAGIGKWHSKLEEEALSTLMVTLETGRQYIFPDVERMWHGGTNKRTQIANFPVQGFATGDVVQVATIRLWQEMKKLNLKSIMVLTVHDSIIIDTHPDEVNLVIDLVKQLSEFAKEELKNRYNIDMFVPFANETKIGENAMILSKVA